MESAHQRNPPNSGKILRIEQVRKVRDSLCDFVDRCCFPEARSTKSHELTQTFLHEKLTSDWVVGYKPFTHVWNQSSQPRQSLAFPPHRWRAGEPVPCAEKLIRPSAKRFRQTCYRGEPGAGFLLFRVRSKNNVQSPRSKVQRKKIQSTKYKDQLPCPSFQNFQLACAITLAQRPDYVAQSKTQRCQYSKDGVMKKY